MRDPVQAAQRSVATRLLLFVPGKEACFKDITADGTKVEGSPSEMSIILRPRLRWGS